ncbi:hypothetical protein [Cytobacillus firmus]|uniref:hypothetical protein n=1 Tax=Cytobacillus firmus TaxID=1399 RepID=UPI0020424A80|nr:hypothetical protein [Cytobacillus firmus]
MIKYVISLFGNKSHVTTTQRNNSLILRFPEKYEKRKGPCPTSGGLVAGSMR